MTILVLSILDKKRAVGAEVDSSARDPPPRCHPETRQELRERITYWLINAAGREWDMIWLVGPAGVGKSAVAQTIAEYCQEIGRLGASFFFSRLNNHIDPKTVVPTLAYRLAADHPGYRNAVTQIIADDQSILEKTLRAQFKKLIVDPFRALMIQNPLIVQDPLLIVLDGLDECNNEDAQCEFINLISEYVRLTNPSPLLWLVCSRPEWHLKRIFSRADFSIGCKHEELTADAAVDKEDVYCILRDGFREIQKKYFWDIHGAGRDKPWPTEAQLQQLADKSGGLPILVSTILRFVGDPDAGDPEGQLRVCLSFLGNSRTPNAANPLHGLDLLYRQIMSCVPPDMLPLTKRILSFCLSAPEYLKAQTLANLLELDQTTFYRALRKLHSVLEVPPSDLAHARPLKFIHASYGDFLRDPARSGKFGVDEAQARCDIAVHLVRLYNRLIQPNCKLPSASQSLVL